MPIDLSNDPPSATSVLKRRPKKEKVKPITNSSFFMMIGMMLVLAGVLLTSVYGTVTCAYVYLSGLGIFFIGLFMFLFTAVSGILHEGKKL